MILFSNPILAGSYDYNFHENREHLKEIVIDHDSRDQRL